MSSLYKKWSKKAYEFENQGEYDKFWEEYLPKETNFYKYLLKNKEEIVSGNIVELGQLFGEEPLTVVGFIDGINTSLKEDCQIDVEKIDEKTPIKLDIDMEKLYFNMHAAKAQWLYELEEWDEILSKEKREEIAKEYKKSKIYINDNKTGRNEPCPCGSGKKYKKCCGKAS